MQHYSNGQWSERDDAWLEPIEYDASDTYVLEENMATEGYIGCGDSMMGLTLLTWHAYGTRPKGAPEYLIVISLHGTVHNVSAETLVDAMDLMSRWAPLITAERLTHWHELKELWKENHAAETAERARRRAARR